jgi:hypothetical protein
VTQAEVELPARAIPVAAHDHAHHAHRHPARSLLGASVPARLAIVAVVGAVLWLAIAWALT